MNNSFKEVVKQMHLNNVQTLNVEITKNLDLLVPLLQSLEKEKQRYLEDIGSLAGFKVPQVPEEIKKWVKMMKEIKNTKEEQKQQKQHHKKEVKGSLAQRKQITTQKEVETSSKTSTKPKKLLINDNKEKIQHIWNGIFKEQERKTSHHRINQKDLLKQTTPNIHKTESPQKGLSEKLHRIKEQIEYRDSEEDSSEFEIIDRQSLPSAKVKCSQHQKLNEQKLQPQIIFHEKQKPVSSLTEEKVIHSREGTLLDDEVVVPTFPSQPIQLSQSTSMLNRGFESGQ
ncbi:hypothetical protein ENU1_113190 [Entamoeba nuttalli P19]|uniref:Uncharacterized protein n=2 Tax=Entamoeba nuttalli TaxID=412467 RepID=K2HUE3_ENTNP|nr:hypothetical protein ENU1_113190 [Entamoeba nuttalli P19]EKE39840.1 hypothetical protein ENU1_113190 [Entamoeba nuttalli P19]|eukprot:XP_008857841.1 hypothetical protein ENU1_113190 [Entamoeba nuttalli P19]